MLKFKENWEESKQHFLAHWNKEYYERCSLSIQVIDKHPTEFINKFSVEDRYCNPEVIDAICREMYSNRKYFAESIPAKYIDFGTGGHCEYFGCKPKYTNSTVWFEPAVDEPISDLVHADLSNNSAYERQKNLVKDMVALSKNDYFVSMTDNCGIVDALAEIRGTENLLCDMLEEPEFVQDSLIKIQEAWDTSTLAFHDIITKNNLGGSTHGWMQLWAPGSHSQLQCDFSVMISPSLFEEFVLQELENSSKILDYASYHLDGVEEVRHLDMILSVKNINNIQWTPVAGQSRTSEHIDVFKRIQKAGKGLILAPQLDEVETIMKELSHNGLHLIIHGVKSEEMANDIINMAKKHAHA